MSPARVRTGVFLILTGVLLLLNTTGRLGWDFWVELIWLWPMLLIALGLEKLLLATKAKNLAYVSSLILLLTVIWAWSSYAKAPHEDEPSYTFDADFTQAYPLDSTMQALVAELDFGAGRLTVGATSDKLFDGSFYSPRGRPRVSMDKEGSQAVVRVRSLRQQHVRWWPGRKENRWKIYLTDRLPLRLNVDCGAAKLKLDLSLLRVEQLDLDCGASEIDLTFGGKCTRVEASINCGVSEINIRIPHGAGLRIHRDTAISSFSTRGIDLVRRGSYRETRDFDSAPVQIKLEIDAGVSSFRISYSDETVKSGTI